MSSEQQSQFAIHSSNAEFVTAAEELRNDAQVTATIEAARGGGEPEEEELNTRSLTRSNESYRLLLKTLVELAPSEDHDWLEKNIGGLERR